MESFSAHLQRCQEKTVPCGAQRDKLPGKGISSAVAAFQGAGSACGHSGGGAAGRAGYRTVSSPDSAGRGQEAEEGKEERQRCEAGAAQGRPGGSKSHRVSWAFNAICYDMGEWAWVSHGRWRRATVDHIAAQPQRPQNCLWARGLQNPISRQSTQQAAEPTAGHKPLSLPTHPLPLPLPSPTACSQ